MGFDETTLDSSAKKRAIIRIVGIPVIYTTSQKSRYDVGMRSPFFNKQAQQTGAKFTSTKTN